MSDNNKSLKPKPEWIQDKEGLKKDAVEFAEKLGKELVDVANRGRHAMTTSQVRNFFGEVRRIQMKRQSQGENKSKSIKAGDFYMLRPKLAYAVARVSDSRNKITVFKDVVNDLLDAVRLPEVGKDNQNEEEFDDFDNFVAFLEATVAYHKVYGGK